MLEAFDELSKYLDNLLASSLKGRPAPMAIYHMFLDIFHKSFPVEFGIKKWRFKADGLKNGFGGISIEGVLVRVVHSADKKTYGALLPTESTMSGWRKLWVVHTYQYWL